jgi:hypothetical protein
MSPSSPAKLQALQGVPEITAHEDREALRVQQVRDELQRADVQLRQEQAEAVAKLDQDERAAARSDLEQFRDQEMPKILQQGEAERVSQLASIDREAKARTSKLATRLTQEFVTSSLRS